MLVIQGFFENGVFTPNEQVSGLKGRQAATLNIQETRGTKEAQEHAGIWTEILEDLRNCEEELTGEPERIHFRTPHEIDVL